jgi:hypothetical protein
MQQIFIVFAGTLTTPRAKSKEEFALVSVKVFPYGKNYEEGG